MAGAPIDIRFSRGINAQDDARTAEQPYLLTADNIYFDREGGPRKRTGYQLVTANQSYPTYKINFASIVAHKEELLGLDNGTLYSYADSSDSWVPRGILIPTTASQRPASPTAATQTWCDVASLNNAWEVIVYQNSPITQYVYLSIRDKSSGAYIRYGDTAVIANVANPQPRLVRTAGGFLLIYLMSDGWYAKPLGANPTALNYAGATGVKFTSSTGLMDVIYDGTYTVVAVNTGTSAVTLFGLDANGVVTLTRIITGQGTGTGTAINIAPYNPVGATAGKFIVTYASMPTAFPSGTTAALSQEVYDAINNVYIVTKNSIQATFASVVSVRQVSAVYNAFIGGINTIAVTRTASTSPVADTGQYESYYTSNTGSGFVGLMSNAVMASKPFVYISSGANGSSGTFVYMTQATTRVSAYTYTSSVGTATTTPGSQSSVLLLSLGQGVIAQLGYGVSVASDKAPPPVTVDATGNLFEVPTLKTVRLTASVSTNSDLDTINEYYMYGVKFVSASQMQSVRFGDVRVFSGGLNWFYDAAAVSEQGFLAAPEILGISFSFAGAMAAGIYQVCAIYEWTDGQGNLHRSAPGAVTTLTIGTAATLAPTISVSNPPTRKQGVSVVLYGTKANGSIFYRLSAYATGTGGAQGATASVVTFPSGATSAETLYTTGNVLGYDPWPNSAVMAASRNRVFVSGGEDSDLLTFSNAYVKGQGLSLSLAFTKRLAAVPGAVTALAAMDDKVIVFKQRAILWFYGTSGPGVDGSNDDFSPSQVLTTEVGCISKSSVLTTAEGVYFQSEKGIWLLNRSMALSFVGQPIAPLTAAKTITSAVLMPTQTTIRFGTADGSAFIYHYRLLGQFGDSLQCGQWTTFSNYRQNAATVWRGNYTFARYDGRACKEVAGYYRDDTQTISFTLRTAWLRTGALLQWGAFTDLAMLGTYDAPHSLTVKVYRDYRSSTDTVLKYDSQIATATTLWGSDPTLGGRLTFGGDSDDTYVARWRLPNACAGIATVSFTLSDSGTPGYELLASCQPLGLNLLGQAQNELVHTGDKKRQ